MATARTKKETVAGSVKPANTAVEQKVESAATKMEPVKEKKGIHRFRLCIVPLYYLWRIIYRRAIRKYV